MLVINLSLDKHLELFFHYGKPKSLGLGKFSLLETEINSSLSMKQILPGKIFP